MKIANALAALSLITAPALAAEPSSIMLITVSSDGIVRHDYGYKTPHDCEEAKSLATTGMTLEARRAAEDAEAAKQQKVRDDFYAAHPPRQPADESERRFIELTKSSGTSLPSAPTERCDQTAGNTSMSWGGGLQCSALHITQDFLIQDDPPHTYSMGAPGGTWQAPRPRYAECVRPVEAGDGG